MSDRYSGGIISQTPVTPSGNTEESTAPGIWTLEQQAYWRKQNLWPTFGIPIPANAYVEYMFSSYMYSGTGASQTITNGVNLSGKGGLVWIKSRSAANAHCLFDTTRGALQYLASNTTDPSQTQSQSLTSFNTDGFTLGTTASISVNNNGQRYVAWTFREQPKFFDIVTWSGDGLANKVIPHNLGSSPGCILVKQTNTTRAWAVFHRSLSGGGTAGNLVLNTTAAEAGNAYFPAVSSTEFQVSASTAVNESGGTYVAYLFAHDAGGFGATGTENIVSCGSYTGNGSATGPVVTLGYEPQWVLVKRASGGTANWFLYDTMRGFPTATGSETRYPLIPNTTDQESTYASTSGLYPTSTGFSINTSAANFNASGNTYIYIAIRRGPMQVPTVGTTVYAPITYTGTAATTGTPALNAGFPVDWALTKSRSSVVYSPGRARLMGNTNFLNMTSGGTQNPTGDYGFTGPLQNYYYTPESGSAWNGSGTTYVVEAFRRAASFMDVVCYTGTGSNQAISHNLTVAPQLMIVSPRTTTSTTYNVYSESAGPTRYLDINTSSPYTTSSTRWNNTAPTSSVFTVGTQNTVNASGSTYIAVLFATAPGVSKVGYYVGTGALQTIDCGFTTGARFVMIKRLDSVGDWYYWDSARGISSGNDPYLAVNLTDAEVTGTNYVDTDATGFKVTAAAPIALNANGGEYIFLAVA